VFHPAHHRQAGDVHILLRPAEINQSGLIQPIRRLLKPRSNEPAGGVIRRITQLLRGIEDALTFVRTDVSAQRWMERACHGGSRDSQLLGDKFLRDHTQNFI